MQYKLLCSVDYKHTRSPVAMYATFLLVTFANKQKSHYMILSLADSNCVGQPRETGKISLNPKSYPISTQLNR